MVLEFRRFGVKNRVAGVLGLSIAGVSVVGAPLVALPSRVQAAPEPDAVPRRWELRLNAGDLRVATVDVPGVGPRLYLYMTYKVVNNSGEDRDFAPWFELATDTGQIARAGRNVPASVVQHLLKTIDNAFLQDEWSVQGRLLQGEENAREAIVVWEAPDVQASEYTVFAMGFSGETKSVARPDTGEEVVLRKSLMLVHRGTGRLDPTIVRPLARTQERWILR